MELTPEQKKRLRKIANLVENGNLALAEHLFEIEERIEREIPSFAAVIERMKGDKGDKGDSIIGEQGIEGIPGRDGINGTPGKDGLPGRPGRDGIDGVDGKDGKDGRDGRDGRDGQDGSPDDAEDIRNKLELLQGNDRLDKSAIKGFDEIERIARANAFNPTMGPSFADLQLLRNRLTTLENNPVAASGTWYKETPSGTINSVNKTFTLANTPTSNSLHLFLNGAYQTDGGEDYTLSGLTITFIVAPLTGSVLRAQYQ